LTHRYRELIAPYGVDMVVGGRGGNNPALAGQACRDLVAEVLLLPNRAPGTSAGQQLKIM
jgi:hypothetical protein